MILTFNELREIKDKLPSGSMKLIADRLNVDEETVRNYFGGTHYQAGHGQTAGIHIEQGPNGGVVSIDDDTIIRVAKEIIAEHV
jgi:hypothetical protein